MSPSLITTMTSLTVGMFSPPMSVDPKTREEVAVVFFDGQTEIGAIMVCGILVAVPLMLCVIPCVACCNQKKDAGHDGEFQRQEPSGGNESEENQLIQPENQNEAQADIKAYEDILNAESGDGGHHGLDEIFIH